MADLTDTLQTALAPWLGAPAWYVAFSGGLDSTVLLHLLAELGRRQELPPVTALHVHHGLQPAAEAWPAHCARVCAGLGIPLRVLEVQVAPGASLEAAARRARYEAFAEVLGEGELLLTAQHRDDQAETLLFRLLRGAGVQGLAGMPVRRSLGPGTLLRPLLGVGRARLEAWARQQGLAWVEDPSNADAGFDRNFLRHAILPVLRQRWPAADASLARAAGHLDEARALLDELAMEDLQAAGGPHVFDWLALPSLALAGLRGLSPARQRNLLRHWLAPFELPPDTRHWAGWAYLRDAAPEAAPRWRLGRGEVVRSGERIWYLPSGWDARPLVAVDWPAAMPEHRLPGNGLLRLEGVRPEGRLQVAYRQGGERLTLAGRGTRDLKRLLNEQGVPGFLRARLPLLYGDGRLLAVANLPDLQPPGLGLHWQPPGLS